MTGRRRGEGRMDAAVEHFSTMGYDKTEVRKVINGLFKNVYGERCWQFVEADCYSVVHEVLLEKEQEEKLQLQQQEAQEQEEECEVDDEETNAQEQEQEECEAYDEEPNAQEQEQEEECEADDEEPHAQEQEQQEECEADDEEPHAQEQEQEQQEEDEEPQQEAAMMGAMSEDDMPIVNVHGEAPFETELEVEQTEEIVQAVLAVELTEDVAPMIMDPPAPEAASPHPTATGVFRTRRPCYGWISESESDSDYEEYLATRQQQVHVPNAGGI